MPYLQINGADLYYETFGEDIPGKAPVVLIHGSTGTGRSNWCLVAPLLARQYFVILPDCRGHGRSSNPKRSYSFDEMAADTAALVGCLGYRRAHIIGHSNGGNVALVTLLEQVDVVQTAVLQAANAYVSPDLIEREPPIFDPERVAREDPTWRDEMIALHGETHGRDYWRELLSLTLKELVSEPNYTSDDLGRVQRPVLVIQGENDQVNAPSKHAQFIARHIPDAELWTPGGIGHTVHDEMLFPWIDKVLDFLERRGNDDRDAVYRLGRACYRDERETIFQVRISPGLQAGREVLSVCGQVLTGDQHQAVRDLFERRAIEDEVQVLLGEDTPWALVNKNVTDIRREPGRFSERVSQALLGEAVRILEEQGEWARVRLEGDGYLGWMQTTAIHRCDRQEVESYRQASNCVVVAGLAPAYLHTDSREGKEGGEAGILPFGVRLPLAEQRDGLSAVRLPDGSCWWVATSDLLPISEQPDPDAEGVKRTLDLLRRFIGVPYLWGGRSPFGFDCSGLAQIFLGFMGVQARRDADQQFKAGLPVEGDFRPGDLLFFGEASDGDLLPGESSGPRRSITHVAISLGRDLLIHASGSAGGVAYNSLAAGSPLYQAWLKEELAGGRRYS